MNHAFIINSTGNRCCQNQRSR